jgi:hypothetical protein
MNGDVEELLREGLDRLTAKAQVPSDMMARVRAHRRRQKIAVRTALACGTAAVTATAVIAVAATGARSGTSVTNAQTTAYVIKRVESALAAENYVIQAQAAGTSSWTYGNRWRMEEFWDGKPYWADGTALIGGKLTWAYVTYYDHRYSLAPWRPVRLRACSTTAKLVLGGPAVTMPSWPAFIKAMLGCQAATVTGHTRIEGVETTVISGSVDVTLSKGYAKTVRETRAHVRYTLYVDSATYLPVRTYGSTETYGGAGGPAVSAYVTNVRWLSPTPANIAKALITIPPGYQLWKGPSTNQ